MPLIALVDDDPIFQFTATRLIESANLSNGILHFENGSEITEYLSKYSSEKDKLPDYIFLDINMPLVDGWMFLEEYQKIKSTLPKELCIYMVSSSIDPRDISRAKEFNDVKDFVIKPVTVDRFTTLLKS